MTARIFPRYNFIIFANNTRLLLTFITQLFCFVSHTLKVSFLFKFINTLFDLSVIVKFILALKVVKKFEKSHKKYIENVSVKLLV